MLTFLDTGTIETVLDFVHLHEHIKGKAQLCILHGMVRYSGVLSRQSGGLRTKVRCGSKVIESKGPQYR